MQLIFNINDSVHQVDQLMGTTSCAPRGQLCQTPRPQERAKAAQRKATPGGCAQYCGFGLTLGGDSPTVGCLLTASRLPSSSARPTRARLASVRLRLTPQDT